MDHVLPGVSRPNTMGSWAIFQWYPFENVGIILQVSYETLVRFCVD